jgi:PAS domain S-box-containing protein
MNEILGRPAKETVEDADEWVRPTHPDDLLIAGPIYARVLAGEEDRFDQVFRAHHADGSWRWVRGRAKVTARDAGGRPTRLSGTLTDIHEGKVAQERLVASEARFRAIASSTSVGILQTDAAGNNIFLNAAGEKIIGLSAQEARGSGWIDAVHPDDRDRVAQEWTEAAAAGRDFSSEYRFLLPDRGVTWVRGYGSSVWGGPGKSLGYVGVFVDITDRKRTEEALASSEAKFRRLFESLTDGLVVVDMCGAILESNESYRQMLGYSAEELRTKTYLDLTPESWHAAEARIVEEQVLAHVHSAVYEKEYRRKDGSIFPVELRTFLIVEKGRPTAMWAIVRDITETRTLRLQLAMASRLSAMGTLVAGVAHEINNPLSAELSGQGFAQEVIDDVRIRIAGSTLPGREDLVRILAQAAEALDDAQEGGLRIKRIVKDMAALANPDPRRRRLRLIDVVEDTRRWLLASVADGCLVKLEDREAPDVLASAGQMEQVLLILVSNAAMANAKGTDRKIVIRVGPGLPGMARVEVIDHGIGIDPAIRDHIFDPFFTTRPAGTERGTGLGLAISHAIVTAHGGTLTFESEVGKGSTFRVELPAAPAEK